MLNVHALIETFNFKPVPRISISINKLNLSGEHVYHFEASHTHSTRIFTFITPAIQYSLLMLSRPCCMKACPNFTGRPHQERQYCLVTM